MRILLRILRNKYFLTSLALGVWILFFDKNDVFTQYELISKCKKLEKDKNYYLAEISKNQAALKALQDDKKYLERFAREKYLMKKDNEDVFVFVAR
jgi:cell division protein FtsB